MFGGYKYSEIEIHSTGPCLGPCFSGCLVGTDAGSLCKIASLLCLGPCFSGCLVGTGVDWKGVTPIYGVSVLVLVDVWWVRSRQKSPPWGGVRCLGPCFSGCLVGT